MDALDIHACVSASQMARTKQHALKRLVFARALLQARLLPAAAEPFLRSTQFVILPSIPATRPGG